MLAISADLLLRPSSTGKQEPPKAAPAYLSCLVCAMPPPPPPLSHVNSLTVFAQLTCHWDVVSISSRHRACVLVYTTGLSINSGERSAEPARMLVRGER